MPDKKNYVPMSLNDAQAYLNVRAGDLTGADLMQSEVLLYAELLKLHERLDDIENQAADMMSPEAMMGMAEKFLGGSMTGGSIL